jgi:hypothetical protein
MSDFEYVNIGPNANDGLGDSLRDAFLKVNFNFSEISAGNANITVNAPVQTVAGRTGNIVLTTNDVSGAASVAYVRSLLQGNNGLQDVINQFANLSANVGNLTTTVTAIDQAFDPAVVANLQALFANTVQQEIEIAGAFANINSVQANLANTISNLNFTQLTNSGYVLSLDTHGNLTTPGNVTIPGTANIATITTAGIYTNSYYYANGQPFVSTTLANTAEIVANVGSGHNVGLSLTPTGVTAGSYGSSSAVPTFSVDQHGRIVFAANVPVAGVSNVAYDQASGNLTVSTSAGTNFVVNLDVGITESPTFANLTVTNNFVLPTGNTAARPVSLLGEIRINTDLNNIEFYNGTAWVPIINSLTTQTFIGDSINATYLLDYASSADGLLVSINGALQEPNEAYTVSGMQITFGEILTPMDVVSIRFLASITSISANSAVMPYTMGNTQNWHGNVYTVSSALDQIAARLKAAGL